MQTALASTRGCAVAQRQVSKLGRPARRTVACKAEVDTKVNSVPATANKLVLPEWIPEQAAPVFEFLNASDFKLEESSVYKSYLQTYLENPYVVEYTGFKKNAETINGRGAMIGFLAAAGAEIFGAGSFLTQLSKFPQPVLVLQLLIVAGSLAPALAPKFGRPEADVSALLKEYSLPQEWFSESLERVHGRLAMLGLAGLIAVELVKGSAVL